MKQKQERITAVDWAKQPEETQKSYNLFARYLDMEYGRSIGNLHRTLNEELPEGAKKVSLETIKNTAWRYNWRERAAAYDEHQREIRRSKLEQQRNESLSRRIAVLEQMLDKLGQAVEHIDPRQLSPEVLIHMLSQTTHMLRIEYGEESSSNNMQQLRTLEATATTIRVEFDNDSQLSFGDLGGDWEQYVPPGARRAPDTQQLPDEQSSSSGHEKEQNGSMDNLVVE